MTRILNFSLVLVFLISTASAFAQWETSVTSGLHEAVAVYDDQHFGIVEANGTKLTSDGGNSFDEYDLVDLFNTPILGFIPTDLEYLDESTLLCSGFFLGNEFEGIMKSVNGGQNWNFTYELVIDGGALQINDMHLAGNGVVYAVGRSGTLLKSLNNGDSWSTIETTFTDELLQLYAVNEDVFGIGAEEGIYLTTDGGETWTTNTTDDPIRGIYYKDESTIMACSSVNQILYTENGGANWELSNHEIFDMADVVHIEGDDWLLAAFGTYYRTNDNGDNWYLQNVPNGGSNQALVKNGELFLGRRTNSIDWTNTLPEVPTNLIYFLDIEQPQLVCAGETELTLEVSNEGANEIYSMQFDVYIDGQFSETIFWDGSLAAGDLNQSIFLTINTVLSDSDTAYELIVTTVNEEVNNYPDFAEQSIQLEINGFSGEFLIGPDGDYPDLLAFKADTDFKDLCGDLIVSFEDGTYTASDLQFNPGGFHVEFKGVEGESAEVQLQGRLRINSFDFWLEGSFTLRDIKIEEGGATESSLLEVQNAFNLNLHNVAITCDPEGTNTALYTIDVRNVLVENSLIVANVRDLRISESVQLLRIENSELVSSSNAILIDETIGRVDILNSEINVNSGVLDVPGVSFMEVKNNTFVRSNNVSTMMDAAGFGNTTIDECFIQIENNTFVSGGGMFLLTGGNVQIRNNIFHAPNGGGGNIPVRIETPSFFNGQFIDFTNNIIHVNEGVLGPLLAPVPENGDITVDYNAYYGTFFNNVFGPGTGPDTQEALVVWQETSGLDQNSFIHQTVFDVEDAGRPINSVGNAAIIDASPSAAPITDIEGTQRVGPPFDLGAFEINGSSLDAAVEDIIPDSQCSGEVGFYTVITNVGTTTITDLEFEWSVDGVIQESMMLNGPLEPLQYDTLFLGSLFFDPMSTTTVDVEIIAVNGDIDDVLSNNQHTILYQPLPFSNEMHIGDGQEYTTAAEALDVLIENGMCGDIDLVFHPGVHDVFFENYIYPEGLPNYKLTFRSFSGDYADTQLVGVGGGGLRLEQFLDVRFEGLNILGPQYPAISLFGKLNSVELNNCRFENILFLNGEDDGPAREFVKITNCLFQSGVGGGTAFRNFGNSPLTLFLFENNVVETDLDVFSFGGIDVNNTLDVQVRDNRFVTIGEYAITLTNCVNSTIERNHIEGDDYQGIFVEHGDFEGNHIFRNNFFLGSDNFDGVRINGSLTPSNLIVHNTFRGGFSGMTILTAKVEAFNNIFEGTYAPVYISALGLAESTLEGNIYAVEEEEVAIRIDSSPISLADFQTEYNLELNAIQYVVNYDEPDGYSTSDPQVDGFVGEVSIPGYATVDIENNPRDEAFPDVGCYEFESTDVPLNMTLESVSIATDFCDDVTTAIVEVTNNGVNEVTSFNLILTLPNSSTEFLWEGSLLPGESLEVLVEGVTVFVDGPSEGTAIIDLVNNEADNLPLDNEIPLVFEGHALSGLLFIGDSEVADYQDLESFLDAVNQFGFCGDVDVLILPGTYQFPEDFTLNDDFIHLKTIGSLNQDPSTVIIQSEYDIVVEGFNQWEFNDLTFQANGSFRTLVKDAFLTNFTDCHFESGSFPALDVVESSTVAFDECNLTHALAIFDVINFSFTNGVIDGFVQAEEVRNFTLVDNDITSPSDEFENYGLNFDGNSTDFDIQRNRIKGNFFQAVNFGVSCNCEGTEVRRFVNNIIEHQGIEWAVYLNGIENIQFYHNTVISTVSETIEVFFPGEGVEIDNNIFISDASNAVILQGGEGLESFDNNVVFSSTLPAVSGYEDITDLNESVLINANDNIEVDPQLLPFTMTVSNPEAAYTGLPVGVIEDIEMELRDLNMPMAGAIEAFDIVQEPLPGDINGDGVVDTADLLLVLGNMGCTEDCSGADLDGDGIVSISDMLLVIGGYGG